MLFLAVAETLSQTQAVCLSYTSLDKYNSRFDRNASLSTYPHYYTGAVASYGYPVPDRWGDRSTYYIELGGQPINTYTTLTLHSPPSSLRSDYSLEVLRVAKGLDDTGMLSKKQHTPLSVFTPSNAYILVYVHENTTTGLIPPFIFSFRGKQHCQSPSVVYYNKDNILSNKNFVKDLQLFWVLSCRL